MDDMDSVKKWRCLSGSTLKLIALLVMAVDHLAASILYYRILLPAAPLSPDMPQWTIYRIYNAMRFVGRIAWPVFAFLMVEGFFHTSSRKKYAFRLLLFALISEYPFDLALGSSVPDFSHQNIFFTLLIGFCVLQAMEAVRNLPGFLFFQTGIVFAGCLLAWLLHTDYDWRGIILLVVLYLFRPNRLLMTAAGCVSLLWEAPACLAFLPINLYNGKKGFSMKYFFYLFYPAHLLILGLIRHLLR